MKEGLFTDQSSEYGLWSGTEGWWHVSRSPVDLNGDGHVDLALGNHGLNSRFRVEADRPLSMYVNDFDLNGSVEHVICSYNGNTSYPVVMKDVLVGQIPALEKKYRYSWITASRPSRIFFSEEIIGKIRHTEGTDILESCVLINSGSGSFQRQALPAETQFSPIFAIVAEDFNQDGHMDLLMGGTSIGQNLKQEFTGQVMVYFLQAGLMAHGLPNRLRDRAFTSAVRSGDEKMT